MSASSAVALPIEGPESADATNSSRHGFRRCVALTSEAHAQVGAARTRADDDDAGSSAAVHAGSLSHRQSCTRAGQCVHRQPERGQSRLSAALRLAVADKPSHREQRVRSLLPQSVIPSISGPVLPSASGQSVWGSAARRAACLLGTRRLRSSERHGARGGSGCRPGSRRGRFDPAGRPERRRRRLSRRRQRSAGTRRSRR